MGFKRGNSIKESLDLGIAREFRERLGTMLTREMMILKLDGDVGVITYNNKSNIDFSVMMPEYRVVYKKLPLHFFRYECREVEPKKRFNDNRAFELYYVVYQLFIDEYASINCFGKPYTYEQIALVPVNITQSVKGVRLRDHEVSTHFTETEILSTPAGHKALRHAREFRDSAGGYIRQTRCLLRETDYENIKQELSEAEIFNSKVVT